ncbi:MAG TPA: DNA gyrase inhibitor YacG [Vicinamibacterales bacterium]|nr:DNA gyrase inhibitor YacG [Vicinamibacterales bacterium]
MGEARLCVLCRTRPMDERWRPFCSERCRNEDLARWADGRYHVAGDPEPSPDSASLDSDASNDLDPD